MTQNLDAGDNLGPWKLVSFLGGGGNGVVWEAVHNDGTRAAVKILRKPGGSRERFRRFRNEVTILRKLGDRPGILPLIYANVPERPGSEEAWLAIPVATKIRDELGDSLDLERVVEAVQAIAQTLAELAQEGITHRDIKPENLFYLQGHWVLGDFGLVRHLTDPDIERLTAEGKAIGSRNYLAPELRVDPDKSDYNLSDVYALGKTLWVLASRSEDPIFGEHRTDRPHQTISHYFAEHLRARYLDPVLERITSDDPKLRGTMADLATDLQAWLVPFSEPLVADDVSDLQQQLHDLTEYAQRDQRAQNERINLQNSLFNWCSEAIRPFREKFDPMFSHGTYAQNVCSLYCPSHRTDGSRTIVESGACGHYWGHKMYLLTGIGGELFDDNKVYILALHALLDVSDDSTIQSEVVWAGAALVPRDSPQEHVAVAQLNHGLIANLRPALTYLRDATALKVQFK